LLSERDEIRRLIAVIEKGAGAASADQNIEDHRQRRQVQGRSRAMLPLHLTPKLPPVLMCSVLSACSHNRHATMQCAAWAVTSVAFAHKNAQILLDALPSENH
jgi:hypothetical protein